MAKHKTLAKAGKVKNQTPKVPKQAPKSKILNGRAAIRAKYRVRVLSGSLKLTGGQRVLAGRY